MNLRDEGKGKKFNLAMDSSQENLGNTLTLCIWHAISLNIRKFYSVQLKICLVVPRMLPNIVNCKFVPKEMLFSCSLE